jgi:hypothetical protein
MDWKEVVTELRKLPPFDREKDFVTAEETDYEQLRIQLSLDLRTVESDNDAAIFYDTGTEPKDFGGQVCFGYKSSPDKMLPDIDYTGMPPADLAKAILSQLVEEKLIAEYYTRIA